MSTSRFSPLKNTLTICHLGFHNQREYVKFLCMLFVINSLNAIVFMSLCILQLIPTRETMVFGYNIFV